MMDNVAELVHLPLDDEKVIHSEWQELLKQKADFNWGYRNYQPISFFSDYFKNLIKNISDLVDLPYKNILIQVHDNQIHTEPMSPKETLTTVHKDIARLCCITVPIFYSDLEPIYFYDDDAAPKYRGQPPIKKPNQSYRYSKKYPTLVNVNNLHNVRVVKTDMPRILLQISYDVKFQSIVGHKPDIWTIIE
jgi:hypothetical protein